MNLKSPPRTAEENKIFYFLIIAIVLLFIVFEYLLFHNGFFAISLDESGHTLEAYDWFKGNGQLFSGWLPFQKIVYAFAFRIYYNLFQQRVLCDGENKSEILIIYFYTIVRLKNSKKEGMPEGFPSML